MSYDDIGKPGSEFYPFNPEVPDGVEVDFLKDNHPADSLDNSAAGLRMSWLVDGRDMSGFYYTSRDANPAFFRSMETSPVPQIIFEPRHERIHQYGFTLAKDYGFAVLKAEAVYTRDRWFNVTNLTDTDGVVKQDLFDYIVGLEHVTERGTRLNGQFFQRVFPDHDADMYPDRVESGLTLYASHEFNGNRLAPELLIVQSLNRTDGMARPRLIWNSGQHWRFATGLDIFYGPDDGLFGQYDRSDRIYGEVRYIF